MPKIRPMELRTIQLQLNLNNLMDYSKIVNNVEEEGGVQLIQQEEKKCDFLRTLFFLNARQGNICTSIFYLLSVTIVLTSFAIPFYFCRAGPIMFAITLVLAICCNYYSYLCLLKATESENEPYFPNLAERAGVPFFKTLYFFLILFIVLVITNEVITNTLQNVEYFLMVSKSDDPNISQSGEWYTTVYIDVIEYIVLIFLIRHFCIRPTFHMLRGWLSLNIYSLVIYLLITAIAIFTNDAPRDSPEIESKSLSDNIQNFFVLFSILNYSLESQINYIFFRREIRSINYGSSLTKRIKSIILATMVFSGLYYMAYGGCYYYLYFRQDQSTRNQIFGNLQGFRDSLIKHNYLDSNPTLQLVLQISTVFLSIIQTIVCVPIYMQPLLHAYNQTRENQEVSEEGNLEVTTYLLVASLIGQLIRKVIMVVYKNDIMPYLSCVIVIILSIIAWGFPVFTLARLNPERKFSTNCLNYLFCLVMLVFLLIGGVENIRQYG